MKLSSFCERSDVHVFIYSRQARLDINLNKDVEFASIGKMGVVISSNQDSMLFRFSTESDMRSCHSKLQTLLTSKSDSAFNKRTDSASAEQYFQFYGYLSQQQNMMQDYIRTSTYQSAMLDNTIDFQDKVVLDVGAGSGILSFFAIQAGAKRVYAVEASSMAQHCEALVHSNKLSGKIIVLAGKLEEIDIPEQVDVIVSEPMGYMLFNERMLESYLHAKKWLRPGGKMFPTQGDLHITPFTDDFLYMEQFSKANFWYQPSFHGVDLQSLRQAAVREYFRQPIVDTFDIRICMARSQKYTVDFSEAHESDLYHMEIPVVFTMMQSGTVHGLAFWFDVAFIGSASTIWLSTSPTQPLTHWYQVRCLLQNPIFVKAGQTLAGKVVLRSNRRQSYDVDIELTLPGTSTKSTNTLDLKNPFFRYSGVQPSAPPSNSHQSPTDAYWTGTDASGMDCGKLQTPPQAHQPVKIQPGSHNLGNDINSMKIQPGCQNLSNDINSVRHGVQQMQTNYGNTTMLNGMGDGYQLLHGQSGASHTNLVPLVSSVPVNPGSIPSVMNPVSQAQQTRTSIGGGISPAAFSQHLGTSPQYSVSNQFMIADYVIPSNMVIASTQVSNTAYKDE